MATTPTQDTLSEKIADRVGEKAEKAVEQVTAAAERVGELAGAGVVAAERTDDIARSIQAALQKSVRDQPRITLAGAAITGFVLGALWKLSR
jgi:hypothetical protein